MDKTLTVSSIFSEAWSLFKKHWKIALGVTVLLGILNIIGGEYGLQESYDAAGNVTGGLEGSVVVTIVASILGMILNIGVIYIFLGLVRGQKRRFMDLIDSLTVKRVITYILATIVSGIGMLIGYILLIVPGVILTLMWFFYSYAVVDEDAGVVESLKRSAELTKGHKLELFVLLIVLMLVNILGALALGVGLLITTPVSIFAVSVAYDRLKNAPIIEEAEVVLEEETNSEEKSE